MPFIFLYKMNNNKIGSVAIVVLVAVVLAFGAGFGFGFFANKPVKETPPLGGPITVPSVSTTTHGTAQQSSLLYQWQFNVVESVARAHHPLRNVTSTAVTLNFPSLDEHASTTASSNVTTTALNGAVAGDLVLISAASSSAQARGLRFTAFGCGTDLACVQAENVSSTIINLGPTSFELRLLPAATFLQPGSLKVTTSSTPYGN